MFNPTYNRRLCKERYCRFRWRFNRIIIKINYEGLDAQKKGSEITYYRRYTLTSLLGLQAEDDDGKRCKTK